MIEGEITRSRGENVENAVFLADFDGEAQCEGKEFKVLPPGGGDVSITWLFPARRKEGRKDIQKDGERKGKKVMITCEQG